MSAAAIRCRTVADDEALPGRQALEDGVRRLLERARKRSGASAAEMVTLLGHLQAKAAGTRRSWYDWNERPETVSALTVLAALHLLGPAAAVDAVFGQGADRTEVPSEDQVTALQRQLRQLQQELARQQRRNQAVEARLEELATRLEPAERGMPASARWTHEDVEGHLTALEAEIVSLGQQMGRSWEYDMRISDADPMGTQAERLTRRVGALEARVAQLASMVGVPYGGYPSAPAKSAGEDVLWAWAAEAGSMLRQQLDEVAKRAPDFHLAARDDRGAGETAQ